MNGLRRKLDVGTLAFVVLGSRSERVGAEQGGLTVHIRFSFECSGVGMITRPRYKVVYVIVLVLATWAVAVPMAPELLVIGW